MRWNKEIQISSKAKYILQQVYLELKPHPVRPSSSSSQEVHVS